MPLSGLLIITILLTLILSKRMSALAALILVPILGALLAGFGFQTFDFAVAGIKGIAPIVAMFVFAILFFSILTDAGLFDPIINGILKRVGTNPVYIAIGTAVLAMAVHFDGSGATTFLITIPAMLPLYERLQMDKRVLACIVSLGAGTMNMVPWGGPTIRAASALNTEIATLYTPLLFPQIVGLLSVIVIAACLGKKEAKRIGFTASAELSSLSLTTKRKTEEESLKRPKLFWWNTLITLLALIFLISGRIPPALVFMLGTLLVLLLNYPQQNLQRERILAHSNAAILMACILFAAGVFTGIMKESGMIEAMAKEAVQYIPEGLGPRLPLVLAIMSMPLSLIFDPNSFYFGFLPVIAETGSSFGIDPVTMGQSALLGQMTTGFPLSPLTAATFLLIGLAKVDLADHQRFTFKYAFLITLIMTLVSVIIGIIPLS